jgi:hypothetical protein
MIVEEISRWYSYDQEIFEAQDNLDGRGKFIGGDQLERGKALPD